MTSRIKFRIIPCTEEIRNLIELLGFLEDNYLSAELCECLDEDSCLHGHVEASSDSGALEDLAWSVLLADCHQSWHFILGNDDFLATSLGQADVSWKRKTIGFSLGDCHMVKSLKGSRTPIFPAFASIRLKYLKIEVHKITHRLCRRACS